jgi:flavin-dependent dehydrogenase
MKVGIIGGGPAGSVLAATLAQRGIEAHVYEKARFPRFHIGESLLPCNLPIFAAIGIDEAVFAAEGFPRKHGAHFEHVASGRWVRFPFADALSGDPSSVFQIERTRFDTILLDRAVALGAHLHCPVTVTAVDLEHGVIHHADGSDHYDFIADASGRETLVAKQLGWIDRANDLRRASVFGHVDHLPLAPGAEAGDISIAKADAGWCWQIPIGKRWSIGMVLKREFIQVSHADDQAEADPVTMLRGDNPAEAVFRRHLAFFPQVAERLAGQLPQPVRAIPNISYRVRERMGPRFALLGDAGGFIDPVFSSGVLLATRAGWNLGNRLADHGMDADLTPWKAATDHDLASFFAFIRLWYDGHFIDNLFFSESKMEPVYRGIISLLAGNTTHPDNVFLGMLAKRAADPHWGMPK